MYCDVLEAAYYLGYASPASLYRLLKAGLLKEHVEMHYGQVLLRMVSKGKSPTLAKKVRSLVNFRSGHELDIAIKPLEWQHLLLFHAMLLLPYSQVM